MFNTFLRIGKNEAYSRLYLSSVGLVYSSLILPQCPDIRSEVPIDINEN